MSKTSASETASKGTRRAPLSDQERKERANKIDRGLGDMAVVFLSATAIWLMAAPFFPTYSGWTRLVGLLGEEGITRFFLAFLFLYFSGIVREKNQMRHTLASMVKLIKKHLGDRGGQARREATGILIEALPGIDKPEVRATVLGRLREFSGQDFGDDQAAWKAWFEKEGARTDPVVE